jgi:divalent metal cation (Fe/Co/Zn/Cd) transporter
MSGVTIARETIAHRGRRLEYFTIAWNTVEGVIGVAAGLLAGSISLVGFGMDSFIEVASGATLLWRMSVDADVEMRERNDKLSLRIVGVCFIALAIYIAYEAVLDLTRKTAPEHSIPGIVLAFAYRHTDSVTCEKEGRQCAGQRSYEGGCRAD